MGVQYSFLFLRLLVLNFVHPYLYFNAFWVFFYDGAPNYWIVVTLFLRHFMIKICFPHSCSPEFQQFRDDLLRNRSVRSPLLFSIEHARVRHMLNHTRSI